MLPERRKSQECQRIQVARHTQGSDKIVKITLERYDDALGWYTAGALCIPVHQLPLLEQALEDLSGADCSDCTETNCPAKIIAFPMLAQA